MCIFYLKFILCIIITPRFPFYIKPFIFYFCCYALWPLTFVYFTSKDCRCYPFFVEPLGRANLFLSCHITSSRCLAWDTPIYIVTDEVVFGMKQRLWQIIFSIYFIFNYFLKGLYVFFLGGSI